MKVPYKTSPQQQDGFLMPAVVIIFSVSVVVLLAVFQYVTTISNLSNQVVYRQIALTAARAALDYGKEQFDGNTQYDGTDQLDSDPATGNPIEVELFENAIYRTTFEVKMVSLSLDGRSQRVQGIGRIYLPATATTPRYERTINGEIIRSAIVAGNPSDFSPLAWYDASCRSTSTDPDCVNGTVMGTGTATYTANPDSASILEEDQTLNSYCGGSNSVPDGDEAITFGDCATDPFIPTYFGQGPTGVGIRFVVPSLAKGQTIQSASIQFTSQAKSTATIEYDVRGIKVPNRAPFTTSNSQLPGLPLTTNYVHWHILPWTAANQSSTRQRVTGQTSEGGSADLGPIIQEIIDQPGWVQGNPIAFKFSWNSKDREHFAKLSPVTLTVTTTGGGEAPVSGGEVTIWRDRSGNGHDLVPAVAANKPRTASISGVTPGSSAPNGKPAIEFPNSGSTMYATVPASSGRQSNTYTALTVMKLYGSGTTKDGHATVVGFCGTGGSGSNCGAGTATNRYAPFWRHPDTGFHSYDATSGWDDNTVCAARNTTEKLCKKNNNLTSSPKWALYSSREALVERDMIFRRNGDNANSQQSQFYDPITLNAPYNIVVGGNAQNLSPNVHVEIAEMILYDRMLTCAQIESVELYLANKWGFASTSSPAVQASDQYISEGCIENNIPAY